MSDITVKLQIPLKKSLRDRVVKHARQQGFSSVQDYTRVLFNTVVEQNLRMSLMPEQEISPEAAGRLDRLAKAALRDHKAGKLKSFDNVEDFLADLKKS
jgi:hypothetical protein